jgi:DHA1 family bicyclomycin/chloramphenicol resistance-like MFS transporter
VDGRDKPGHDECVYVRGSASQRRLLGQNPKPSWPDVFGPSTSFLWSLRDKPGHDECVYVRGSASQRRLLGQNPKPSWPDLFGPSTSFLWSLWDKPGHDDGDRICAMALRPVRSLPVPLLTVVLGSVATMAPLGIDGFLPATSAAAAALGTDAAGIQVTLAAFTIGVAIGQIVHGPLSDRVGRRKALLGALALMAAASAAAAAASSLDALTALRVVQGFAAAAGMTVCRAIVRDLFAREQAARVLSYMTVVSGIGPIVFPIVGGVLAVELGWRAVLVFSAAYVAVAALAFAVAVPETNARLNPHAFSPTAMVVAWRTALADAGFRRYLLINCSGNIGLFAFLAASPNVVMGTLGVPPDLYGVYFAAMAACFGVGAFAGGRLVGRLGIERVIRSGATVCLAAGGIVAALAWGGAASVAAVVAPVGLYMLGYGALVPCSTAAALTPFPHIAGAASSAIGLAQQISATLTALAVAAAGASQDALALGVLAGGVAVAALALSAKRMV